MITLKEIAAEAGVSVMTVSNVINNKTAKVSAQTAQRVREIIEKHHYQPNMAARSLSSKASHIIAVLLPLWHHTADSLLLDPYVGQVAGVLETLLREEGYYVMICSFNTAEQALNVQRTWQIDGSVLILPHEDRITREIAVKTNAPLVVIDRYFEDVPMLSVCLNDHKGGYLAARHLLEKGHREIGFACPTMEASSVIKDRYQGYLDALSEFGVVPNPQWLFTDYYGQDGGERIGAQIASMKHRPSAIMTTEDMIACGIIKSCQEKGIHVPDDLSVIGFDNSMPSRLISPGLTTIAQDVREKAAQVVHMLLEAIRDHSIANQCSILDVRLIERQSVKEKN